MDRRESALVRQYSRVAVHRPRLLDVRGWPGAILWYAILAGLACFWRLGETGLVSMEGMVVDGARHMLTSGDWIVPRVYGEIYTYKPALAYWIATAPLQMSEAPPEWMVRLPFAIVGFALGLTVLALIGRLVGSRIGLFSALAVVTGGLFLQKVRIAEFDIALVAGVGVAVAAACHNLASERQRSSVWLLGYLGLAVGFLAKGGPALMAYGPGVLAAAWATGRFRRLFDWRHLAAATVFVALTSGYLWAAWAAEGEKAFEQPLLEAKVRGLGWIWGRTDEAAVELAAFRDSAGEAEIAARPGRAVARTLVKPLFIWAVCLPWSVLLPAAFRRRAAPAGEATLARLIHAARGFLLAGALAFMLTNTHEMRYYLPLSVPLGILCGVVAGGGIDLGPRWRRGLAVASAIVAAVLALATALAGVFLPTPPIGALDRAALFAVGLAALVLVAWVARRATEHRHAALLTIAALCLLTAESLGLQPRRASTRDLRRQAAALAEYLPPEAPVWIPGPADVAGKSASLYFYLGRPTRAFRAAGELPPPGSYCIVPSDRMEELHDPPGFVFSFLGRVEHSRRDYLVGTCSWSVEPEM